MTSETVEQVFDKAVVEELTTLFVSIKIEKKSELTNQYFVNPEVCISNIIALAKENNINCTIEDVNEFIRQKEETGRWVNEDEDEDAEVELSLEALAAVTGGAGKSGVTGPRHFHRGITWGNPTYGGADHRPGNSPPSSGADNIEDSRENLGLDPGDALKVKVTRQ